MPTLSNTNKCILNIYQFHLEKHFYFNITNSMNPDYRFTEE